MLLTASNVLHPTGQHSPGWVRTRGDRIVGVGGGLPDGAPDQDFPGCVLTPGFVDMHVHGGAGAAYTSVDVDKLARVAAFHLRHGTTTTMASLVSASPSDLERSVALLADLVEQGVLAGIHLEGPWLSP
ncbi:MAG: amidohydrolase family protein, partial [Sporichthyaceae bacterium]|nr:amidohydrolase family protein [Sporichthyaceae bacterium]